MLTRKTCSEQYPVQSFEHIFVAVIWRKLSEINWSKADGIELISESNNT